MLMKVVLFVLYGLSLICFLAGVYGVVRAVRSKDVRQAFYGLYCLLISIVLATLLSDMREKRAACPSSHVQNSCVQP